MELLGVKNYKTYVMFALWLVVACAMISFWVTKSVLLLKSGKNSTAPLPQIIQVKSLLDTMMMDQIGNKSFDTLVMMQGKNTTIDRFRQVDKANNMIDKMIQ